MDPAQAELLKREWTGQRVAVSADVPTLRRFAGHLGTVMTVNMNGRALVRFDGPADIGWYDIAFEHLKVVAAPPAPEEAAPAPPGRPPATSYTQPQPEAVEAAAAGTNAKPAKPMSVLELARQQGAAKK
jgi:hypothetical protein